MNDKNPAFAKEAFARLCASEAEGCPPSQADTNILAAWKSTIRSIPKIVRLLTRNCMYDKADD